MHSAHKKKSDKKSKSALNIKNFNGSTNIKIKVRTAKGRSISSTTWLQRQLNDPFVHAASANNLLSRAAYKIMEINDKYHIFRSASSILDLGSAPGSWMQVAWPFVDKINGILVGVDLTLIDLTKICAHNEDNRASFILGDFTSNNVQEKILKYSQKYDVIMSDMSPQITGSRSTDHLNIVKLAEEVEKFASLYLANGGKLIMKIFHGISQNDLMTRLKHKFNHVHFFKPISSRSDSREIYLIAL